MEHRWNPRKEINSRVMVYQPQIGIIKAAVKNISAEGMLVDTGQYALTKGVIVELADAALNRLQSKMLRLKALIVHTDDSAAGLMVIGDRRNVAVLWKNIEDQHAAETMHTETEPGQRLTAVTPFSPLPMHLKEKAESIYP